MTRLFKLHDTITIAGNYLAMALLFGICAAFTYEVGARYLFNAPTTWANALVSYFLCASIFLSAPNLTRLNQHVTIDILRNAMPGRMRTGFDTALRLAAGFICPISPRRIRACAATPSAPRSMRPCRAPQPT